VSRPGTLAWFARHEFRLAWRDWLWMATAGGRTKLRTVAIALLIFVAVMHLIAYGMVSRYAGLAVHPDKAALVAITASALLSLSLMLSQAMESVTRAFYTRSDLDLLLSSPAQAPKIFAVRIATIALSVVAMAALLAGPFINVLAAEGGAHWLGAYGAVVAMGATAAALAVGLTTALFRTIGPRRARLVAQIVAAVIGAAFVIGLQLAAIASNGTLSRYAVLASAPILALAPDAGSLVWWPARAMLGDGLALAAVLAASLLMLGAAIVMVAPRFADCAAAAAGVTRSRRPRAVAGFRGASPMETLRRKEWTLLRRDPWLVSQTLMQMLYLLPPAFLLWRSFENANASVVLLVPVLVMAAGQLAGGLAWLAISGEGPDRHGAAHRAPGGGRQDRGGDGMHCAGVCALHAGAGAGRGVSRHRRRTRHRRGCGVGDRHSALFSRPGQAQPVSPPADVVAGRDLRRGVFLDRLGRRSRTRRGRNLDRGDPRDPCRRDIGGHPPRPPAGGVGVTGSGFRRTDQSIDCMKPMGSDGSNSTHGPHPDEAARITASRRTGTGTTLPVAVLRDAQESAPQGDDR